MQKVAGIVAEYNPFHRGHAHQIAETRRLLGDHCAVLCVMSGDFVQRGDAAVFDKFERAEAAVRGGADLVLELPLRWCLSSAEGFARGAVSILKSAGVVTHLSFGSETGELAPLQKAAGGLRDPALDDLLREELKRGLSFPAARQNALERLIGEDAAVLSNPNDLLAVEYLRAIHDLDAALAPVAVRRVGAHHDAAGESDYPSASELRSRMKAGQDVSAWAPHLPDAKPVFLEDLETAILSRLRMLPKEAFAALPDCAEGLENVLWQAVHSEAALDDILAAAKSKRYPMSRLRRMLLCAALGVKKADGLPPYLRVLAANERGRALLHTMRETASLPVITKPADARDMPEFHLTADAHDLYVLAQSDKTPGQDWRHSPIML
jgi:predicted nucleotidyltransferase